MSKDIIKTPHYYTRCPSCGCHFAFELDDFTVKDSGYSYSYRDYISCPYCKQVIQARDTATHELLHNIKVDYTGGKVSKKMVTVADWSFPEERFESVGFWAQKRDDEYGVDYVFEIQLKDKSTTTISTVDKKEARLWAEQLNIDIQAWYKGIQEVVS